MWFQECPCNSRYGGDPIFYPDAKTKIIEDKMMAIVSGACATGQAFTKAEECYDAIAGLGFNATSITNKTVAAATQPAGCSIVKNADGSADAVFNTAGSGKCAASGTKVGASTSKTTAVTVGITLAKGTNETMTRSAKGLYCSGNKAGILKAFVRAHAIPTTT